MAQVIDRFEIPELIEGEVRSCDAIHSDPYADIISFQNDAVRLGPMPPGGESRRMLLSKDQSLKPCTCILTASALARNARINKQDQLEAQGVNVGMRSPNADCE